MVLITIDRSNKNGRKKSGRRKLSSDTMERLKKLYALKEQGKRIVIEDVKEDER